MISDFKLAFRTLIKSPEYALIALVTLALGIGVNTSAFNLVDAFLFRAAPYEDGERIVRILGTTRTSQFEQFSEPEIPEIKGQLSAAESVAVISYESAAITEPGQNVRQATCIMAYPDLFTVLKIRPQLGRLFTQEECVSGGAGVIVLTDSYWRKRFGANPGIVGTNLRMDGGLATVIGVLPPNFEYRLLWGDIDLCKPFVYAPGQVGNRDWRSLQILARLKDGATAQQMQTELTPLVQRLAKDNPRVYSDRGMRAVILHESVMDEVGRKMVYMIFVLASFVLLIACANLANLQLARSTANMRDLAIRSALGATRFHLVRQQLAECVLLATAGGALGLVIALWINGWLERQITIGPSSGIDLHMSVTTLVATLIISLITGLLFGIVPAWLASRIDLSSTLKQQSRGSTGGRGQKWVRNALIIAEVALALILLSGASLMMKGFRSLASKPTGWSVSQILTANLTLPDSRYGDGPKRVEFYRKLQDRLGSYPGVEGVAISTGLPIFSYGETKAILAESNTPAPTTNLPRAFFVQTTPSYFETFQVPLLEGRHFTDDDKQGGPEVVIINETLAKRFWPNESALGKRLGAQEAHATTYREVVGVVRDVGFVASMSKPETEFQVYRPIAQEAWTWINIAVRSPNPLSQLASIQKAVSEIDPDVPATNVYTVGQWVDLIQHNILLVGQMMTGFSVLGLVLAAVGLYGVISGLVAQRTSEFGIRLALGARAANILGLVLSHGMKLAAAGIVAGIAGSFFISGFLLSIFDRLDGLSGLLLGVLSLGLALITLFATWLPARRATRVDPMIALRAE